VEKKTQLSVILTNAPGELSKLCDVLKAANVNILAISIQNAKDSVKELYNMREKVGRRIALAESYRGILKDSSDYSLIRILVDKPPKLRKHWPRQPFVRQGSRISIQAGESTGNAWQNRKKTGGSECEHRLCLRFCNGRCR